MQLTKLKILRRAPLAVALTLLLWSGVSPSAIGCPCSEIPKPQAPAEPLDQPAGLEFTHTPEYTKEFDAAIDGAKQAITKHAGEPKVAVVADIDETLLDNRPYFEKHLHSEWNQFHGWIDDAASPPLKPTADLLAWARDKGYAVFLITGRSENERLPTIENLLKQHIAYDGLYMRHNGDKRLAEVMKTEHREAIENMGFKIIMSIGDQFSDLYGGHAEDCEKLPNKMYFIP
jgi:predicted secreted acid phosphatase